MGIRLQRRINLGGGAGINVSKSGFSPSLRTQFGTIGAKGFTIRTGIPGLYYRDVFKSSGKGSNGAFFLILLAIGVFVIVAIVAWNVLRMLGWAITELYHYLQRIWYNRRIKREAEMSEGSKNVFFASFSMDDFPNELHQFKAVFEGLLVDDRTFVEKDTELAVVTIERQSAIFTANESGVVTFLKNPGEILKNGDYIYKIEKQ